MKEIITRRESGLQLSLLEMLYRRGRLTEEEYRRCQARWEAALSARTAPHEEPRHAE